MKIVYVVSALVAAVCLNCGGDQPPPQDPSSVSPSTDADAAAPPATDQPSK